MLKVCYTCKAEKDLNDFHKNHCWCKECNKIYCRKKYDPEKEKIRKKIAYEKNPESIKEKRRIKQKKYAEKNKEKHLEYHRLYQRERRSLGLEKIADKEKLNQAVKKWKKLHPQKNLAHVQTMYVLRNGLLLKPLMCEKCMKKSKLEAHHEDYTKPLEIIWCCKSCHGLLDRERRKKEGMNV